MNAVRVPGALRIPILVVAVVVVAIVAAWIAVAALLPPDRVHAIVDRQLAASLARPVRFGGAHVTIFPPVRLVANDVAIAEPEGFASGAALETAALAFDLDAFALLRRELRVRRIAIEKPKLHLVLRPDGTTNFDNLMRPAPPGSPAAAQKPMDVAVAEFSVHDADVVLDHMAAGKRAAFTVNTKLSFSSRVKQHRLATSGETRLTGLAVGPLTARRLGDLNRSLEKLTLTLRHDGAYDESMRRLALGKLDVDFGRTSIHMRGRVDSLGPTPILDLQTRAEHIDLRELLDAAAVADAKALHGISGSGAVDFDLGMRGRLTPRELPAITGTLAVANAAFRYPGAPAGVERLFFHTRFTPDALDIADLRAHVANQPVTAKLAVQRFADPLVRFSVRGNLDLAAVAPMVAPSADKVTGRAVVNVAGSGRAKDPGMIALQGGAKLIDVGVTAPDLPKPIEHVHGDLTFSQQRATVKGLTLQAGRSKMALDASVTRPLALLARPGSVPPSSMSFAFDAPYLDLAEVMPAGGGGPLFPNANGGGTVRIGHLKNERLDLTNVNAKVALEPAIVDVPAFHAVGYGGALGGSGRFDFRNPQIPVIHVTTRVDSVEADQLLRAWTPAKGFLRGALSADMDIAVAGLTPELVKRTLDGGGAALVMNGSMGPTRVLETIAAVTGISKYKQVHFKDAHFPFRVQQGHLVTDKVNLTGPYGDWLCSGAIGFDGALDYAVSITVPPDLVQDLGGRAALVAGALSDDKGRLLIDLHVGGTVKSPRVALDPKAMQSRLAGRVSDAIVAQQNRIEDALKKSVPTIDPRELLKQGASPESLRHAVEDSVKKNMKNVLDGFYKKGPDSTGKKHNPLEDLLKLPKKTAPPPPPPAPDTHRTAPPDTTTK